MVILYHATGQSLTLTHRVWLRGLQQAIRHGWHPTGTNPPPVDFCGGASPRWNGAYEHPCGQQVGRHDALRLAQGIAASGDGSLEELAEFCRESGFLICALEDSIVLSSPLVQMPSGFPAAAA
jgi:hypothetical protein